MELYKIKRSACGTEIEIELTFSEMVDCYEDIRKYNMREILSELLACDGCANVPKEIIDSVVQDALEEQDESGDSVFTAIDTVYKKRNFNKYKQDVPDMSITVGQVIDNPTFDSEMAYKIGRWNDDLSDWETIYDSRQTDDYPSAELLIKKVTYMTISDGQLVLEVND